MLRTCHPPSPHKKDKLIWLHTLSGQFTVKSAYWLMSDLPNTSLSSIWSTWWHVRLPPRLRFLGRRITLNIMSLPEKSFVLMASLIPIYTPIVRSFQKPSLILLKTAALLEPFGLVSWEFDPNIYPGIWAWISSFSILFVFCAGWINACSWGGFLWQKVSGSVVMVSSLIEIKQKVIYLAASYPQILGLLDQQIILHGISVNIAIRDRPDHWIHSLDARVLSVL